MNDEQRQELRRLAREAIGRVSERAHFVLLSDQGKSVPEIGALMGYSAQAVYPWLERYQQHGIAGLYDEPRSGRPPNEPHLVAIVQAQTGQPPANFGYPEPGWTVGRLAAPSAPALPYRGQPLDAAAGLALGGFRLGPAQIGPAPAARPGRSGQGDAPERDSGRCDGDYPGRRRVRHDAVADLAGHLASAGRTTPGTDARPEPQTAHLRHRQPAHRSLALSADRPQAFGRIHRGPDRPADAPIRTGRIYLLVDNGSIHTSKAVQQWLKTHERLQLVSLPSYAGHKYNPTEKIWWHLKDAISANRGFKLLAELDAALRRHFAGLTPQAILRLINSLVARQAQAAVAA